MLTYVMKRYSVFFLLSWLLLGFLFMSAGSVAGDSEEYVYYGFVPVSGDVPSWDWLTKDDLPDWATKLDIPRGHAFLDVIAEEDSTHVEIIDLIALKTLASADLNQMELYTLYIKYGTYFKVISDKPIAVSLGGGSAYCANEHGPVEIGSGYSTPYLASEAGFVGKDFRFMAPPAVDSFLVYKGGKNCLILALEDTTVTVVDSTGEYAARDVSMKQGETKDYLLRARGEVPAFGNTSIWHVTSTGEIAVGSYALTGFTYLPALSGGYIGRLFFGGAYTTGNAQHHAFVLVTPVQEGKVEIYDTKWNKIDEKTFTSDDIEAVNYWYLDLGTENKQIIVRSEVDVTVMCGDTSSPENVLPTETYIGDDITVLGARANQICNFYVPRSAIVFAPTDMTVRIDGESREMVKDSFLPLGSGSHSVVSTDTLIVQVTGEGSRLGISYGDLPNPVGFLNWGTELISPQDVNAEKKVPEGLTPKARLPIEMIAGAAIVAVIAVIVIFRVRKSRARV